MQKLRIFLSHITIESKLADVIKGHLVRDFIGLVDVFVSSDRTSIPVGAKWLSEITEALNRADLHIVFCSPGSVGRPWINFEAGAAHLRALPIIPICHNGLTPSQLPVPLSEYEGILASDSQAYESFYGLIAKSLGSDIPDVNFVKYTQEVSGFESEYTARRDNLGQACVFGPSNREIVRDPRALCISSQQFLRIGFENQIQRVIDAFPATVPHERVFDSMALRAALTRAKFEIVHIAAFVCPRSGDLYFSDVDLSSGQPSANPVDRMSPDVLATLLKVSETRLAVITSCDSLALTASLLSSCHVVATRDMVSAKMMAAWVEAFYGTLAKEPLSRALEFAINASGAPMRLYTKQPASVDFIIQFTDDRAAA